MRRSPLALFVLVLSCGDAGTSQWNDPPLPEAWPEAAPIAFLRAPYLQDPGERRMVVMWRTATPCRGLVEVTSPQGFLHTVPTVEATRFEVALEDLPAHAIDLLYRVACVVGPPESLLESPEAAVLTEPVPFRLAPARGEAFRIAVVGDSQNAPATWGAVAGEILDADPGLLLHAGDLTNDGRDEPGWDEEFFAPAAALLARVPVRVAIGNHEHWSDGFYESFAQPDRENYFSFLWGDAFVIVLDGNAPQIFWDSPEYVWLEETLASEAARAASWRIVVVHPPPWCEGWGDPGYDGDVPMREAARPLLEEGGVDVVFTGHAHDYERGELNGVLWIVTGGGGGSLDSWQQDVPHITVYEPVHHYVLVDGSPATLEIRALDLEGNLIDEVVRTRD